MSEKIESAERFYIVTAHRHGYRDAHSYIVGLFASQSTAILAAEREEAYRGGKYACRVFGTEVLEEWSANPSLNLIREAAEDLRFASPHQQIKNAAAQARREALEEGARQYHVRAIQFLQSRGEYKLATDLYTEALLPFFGRLSNEGEADDE